VLFATVRFLGKDLILETRSFPLGSDLNSIPFAKNKGKAKPMSIFFLIYFYLVLECHKYRHLARGYPLV
jgi:hypothetical protein